jgi:hypothetical protein
MIVRHAERDLYWDSRSRAVVIIRGDCVRGDEKPGRLRDLEAHLVEAVAVRGARVGRLGFLQGGERELHGVLVLTGRPRGARENETLFMALHLSGRNALSDRADRRQATAGATFLLDRGKRVRVDDWRRRDG